MVAGKYPIECYHCLYMGRGCEVHNDQEHCKHHVRVPVIRDEFLIGESKVLWYFNTDRPPEIERLDGKERTPGKEDLEKALEEMVGAIWILSGNAWNNFVDERSLQLINLAKECMEKAFCHLDKAAET